LNSLAATLLIGSMQCCSVLAAEAADPLTIEFYEIHGANQREMRNEIDRLRPSDPVNASRHDGYTHSHVTWTYYLQPSREGCAVRSFETELKVTMTLPRWIKPAGVSARLVEQWETYSAALRVHENGHYEIAVAAAAEVKRRALELRSAEGCKALDQALDVTANVVLDEYRKMHVEYDARTRHGETQGVRFP